MGSLLFETIDAGQIGVIRGLWEALNEHHRQRSVHFAELHATLDFDARIAHLAAAGRAHARLDVVRTAPGAAPGAYCLSTIDGRGQGEVESIYVAPALRSRGVGGRLMEDALAWFEEHGARPLIVGVAYGNEEALAFHERHGFVPRSLILMRRE